MMRNKFLVAVHMFFIQDGQVLLLRRFNTGYEDGQYSVVAGHVEMGETVTQAAVREANEEAGVTLTAGDLQVVHVMNRKAENERIDFFVRVKKWQGEIVNNEPEKCDDLAWFPLNDLPLNIIPYVKHGLESTQKGIYYSEFGW
jgi:ADP-ribose pyrophosphatase YjhB (NUDIX family)